MRYQYKHLVIGGTFDRLHKGHKTFIRRAFLLSRNVIIGLVEKPFDQQKRLKNSTQSYHDRRIALSKFLEQSKFSDRYKIISINDIFGTTLVDKKIEAILVTKETYYNAQVINQMRKKKRLSVLQIELTELIKSQDRKIIRSQRIRFGEINRAGKIYGRMFRKKLGLPKHLRELLRKPIGKIVEISQSQCFVGTGRDLSVQQSNPLNQSDQLESVEISQNQLKPEEAQSKPVSTNFNPLRRSFSEASQFQLVSTISHPLLIAVGDIVSQELEKYKIIPAVKIIDLRTRRQPIRRDVINHVSTLKKTINQPGFIYPRAVQAIYSAIMKYYQTKQSQIVVIKGEEDLLALPAILLAPLGATVVYGQKDTGVVLIDVTEEIKQKITALIAKFKVED